MRLLGPQVCTGRVYHRRLHPATHEFVYPVSYVLFDPERPTELTGKHPLWSANRLAPVQIRAEDYGVPAGDCRVSGDTGSSDRPQVRLLTQPRRWGWLFNPISVYFLWAGDTQSQNCVSVSETEQAPHGVVLEVTNTPWKERHQYSVPLHPASDGAGDGNAEIIALEARFDKTLHVSPFLDEDYAYHLTVSWEPDSPEVSGRLQIGIDAVDGDDCTVVETRLDLTVADATAARLGRSLLRDGFPTHRTSFGIHRQALSLAAKRVPFVAHPRSRSK